MRGDDHELGVLEGEVAGINGRLNAISARLDAHLAACTARFIGIIVMILTVAGILAALIEHAAHNHG